MSIFAFIPLVATVAYIPLLFITASNRPWQRQHKLFFIFLISAIAWSLTDYIYRSNLLEEHNATLIRIVIVSACWMGVQFHIFVSSYFPPNKNRWLLLGYASLIGNIILAVLGFLPKGFNVKDGLLVPDYSYSILYIAAPLLCLLIRDLWVFLPRLKNRGNPIVYNQMVTLVICLGVLAAFMLAADLPFGKIILLIFVS
jgi:hypothetical protein